jgi:hypothetical protein
MKININTEDPKKELLEILPILFPGEIINTEQNFYHQVRIKEVGFTLQRPSSWPDKHLNPIDSLKITTQDQSFHTKWRKISISKDGEFDENKVKQIFKEFKAIAKEAKEYREQENQKEEQKRTAREEREKRFTAIPRPKDIGLYSMDNTMIIYNISSFSDDSIKAIIDKVKELKPKI